MIRRGGNGRGCETEKNPRRKKSEEEKEKETSSLSFTLTCEGLPSPNIHLFFHSHAVDFKRARFCSVSGFWSSFRGKREKTYYSLSPFFSFLSPLSPLLCPAAASAPAPPRGCTPLQCLRKGHHRGPSAGWAAREAQNSVLLRFLSSEFG